jgi:uncharacterized membrane protein
MGKKKMRLTSKESLLILIGILISFMIQILIDLVYRTMDFFQFNSFSQLFIVAIIGLGFCILLGIMLRNVKDEGIQL